MIEAPLPRKARFQVGDEVRTIGPSVRREEIGTVNEIIGSPSPSVVYRYRVAFADGTSDVFFGFELEARRG